MMGKIKGCANELCGASKKKIRYKESESFCSRCGSPLVYVCKDCYTQLPDKDSIYCVRCLAKHKDRNQKFKRVVGGIGSGAAVIGMSLVSGSKKVIDATKNIK